MSARMITTPFGLYDCDVPCDGAIAVIVSAVETVPDLAKPPVRVEAVGTQVLERLSWDQDTLTHLPQSLGPSAHLWTRTSLTPDDVDVALLYDGFTFNALSWLEGLGFCGLGEATDFIAGGETIALEGKLPLNPHGGQLSAGRLHGYGFVREAMLQLRLRLRWSLPVAAFRPERCCYVATDGIGAGPRFTFDVQFPLRHVETPGIDGLRPHHVLKRDHDAVQE
jgi:acetyl-CoA acetyltransferase